MTIFWEIIESDLLKIKLYLSLILCSLLTYNPQLREEVIQSFDYKSLDLIISLS